MSSAKVLSLEALDLFHVDLQQFRTNLLKELEGLDLELRRLTRWLNTDAAQYWNAEHQQIRRRLSEHLQQLSRCMSYVREDERRPCTEEKKRVAVSKERVALCETKLAILKSAQSQWETRTTKCRTKLQRCRDMAESDLMVALGRLLTHIQTLEAYRQLVSDPGRPSGTDTALPVETAETSSLSEVSPLNQPAQPNDSQNNLS